jgi:hypothetical protein
VFNQLCAYRDKKLSVSCAFFVRRFSVVDASGMSAYFFGVPFDLVVIVIGDTAIRKETAMKTRR